MPEDIRISELSNVSSLGNNDLIEVSQVNAQSETGYDSKKATMINVGDRVCNGIEYANALYTSNKKIIGAINELTTYIPVWNNTASGSIATFDTSLALPLQDLQIAINAVQESGTPTPSTPKAISGFTGANITNHGKNYLDTSTNVNGKALSATGAETSIAQACYTDLIKVVVGEKYTFGATSALVDAWNRRIHGYDASGNWVQEIMNSNAQSYAVGTPFTMTFTVPSGISYIRISYYKDTNAQLEKGESASAYQAYNSTTTAISWNDEAGTVYGGSLDVTSGVLTVTWHAIDLGSLTWTYDAESVPAKPYFFCQRDTVQVSTQNLLCSIYQLANVGVSNMPNYSMKSNNKGQVLIVNSDYTDKDTFKTAMSGVLLVCEKLTPETYQLTPTQISAIVGTNNVFTDTNGNTSVVYACSLKDYIDSQ